MPVCCRCGERIQPKQKVVVLLEGNAHWGYTTKEGEWECPTQKSK